MLLVVATSVGRGGGGYVVQWSIRILFVLVVLVVGVVGPGHQACV